MAVCVVNKQKEKEQEKGKVCAGPKHESPTAEDSVNEVHRIVVSPDCMDESRAKVEKAIEANELCYNCETGFHYIKQ